MNSKLVVPARLEQAARELVNNMTILKGCSPEVKEVIAIARQERCLVSYTPDGDKDIIPLKGIVLGVVYCLPNSVEIVVEDEKPQVPQWVKDKYTVCKIANYQSTQFVIKYPDGSKSDVLGLPAALRCDGWVFFGWLHKGYNYVDNCPLMFNTGRDFWRSLSESRDLEGCITSTAYASVWQKAGE